MSAAPLAIILPSNRKFFLQNTLDSILAQKNRNFNLYIGDDHCPEDLYSVVKNYEKDLNIFYHRFDENMGRKSLAGHWERCINLSKDEPWLWLFADDDLMDNTCVEGFFQALEFFKNEDPDIFRFENEVIDYQGNILYTQNQKPEKESSADFLRNRFGLDRRSYASEYIFSRKVFNQFGCVDFPLAWNSDDATWALYAREKGFYPISTGKVQWRASTRNFSSNKPVYSEEKIHASFLFIAWAKSNFSQVFEELGFSKTLAKWLAYQFSNSMGIVSFRHVFKNTGRLVGCFGLWDFVFCFLTYSLRNNLKTKRANFLDKYIFSQRVFIGLPGKKLRYKAAYGKLDELSGLKKAISKLSLFEYFYFWMFSLKVAILARLFRNSVFHFKYPESFMITKKQMYPGNKIIASFHFPPEAYNLLDHKLKEKYLEIDQAIVFTEELKNFWEPKIGHEKVLFIPGGEVKSSVKPEKLAENENKAIFVGNWLSDN